MKSKFLPKCVLISWKNILLLLVLASLMQTINVSLSWIIQKKEKYLSNQNNKHYYEKTYHEDILERVLRSSAIDSSGEFRFALEILVGSHLSKHFIPTNKDSLRNNQVTLVTQCSISRLHHLIQLSKIWQGPISVAVLLLSHELGVGMQYLVKLKKCFPSVNANVTFNVVYPLRTDPLTRFDDDLIETPCEHLQFLSLFNKPNYEQKDVPYPNNLMRNIARRNINTKYVLVIDIDMLPNLGLSKAFFNYVQSSEFVSKEKVVWVLPAYEIQEGLEPPENKTSLLGLLKTKDARPFYKELCWKCQKSTDYEVWESEKVTNNSLVKTAYEVFWRDPWEPFFISQFDMPMHDERFRQYGFNRISQVCELHIAGYRFKVLDSAFVIHLGFKRSDGLHHSKDLEQETNRLLYRQFKTDLKVKYPQSSRRCY